MFGWVDPLMAAGEHGNGAGAKAGKMGGGIDAAGEAGDDTESSVAQLARQPFCELYASRRCVARADDGDQRMASLPRTVCSGGGSSIICSRGR